jgi:hypothetical protein
MSTSSEGMHEILVELRGRRYAEPQRTKLLELVRAPSLQLRMDDMVHEISRVPEDDRELACEDVVLAYLQARLVTEPHPPLLGALREAFPGKCDELLPIGMARHTQSVQELLFADSGIGLRLGAIAQRWLHPFTGNRVSQVLRVIRFLHAGIGLELKQRVWSDSGKGDDVLERARGWLDKARARLPRHEKLRAAVEGFVRELP